MKRRHIAGRVYAEAYRAGLAVLELAEARPATRLKTRIKPQTDAQRRASEATPLTWEELFTRRGL